MKRERTGIAPALAVSAAVHVAALLAVIFLGGLFKKPLELGGGVPVTLVTSGPPEMINAPVADEIQEAQTEEPDPTAPPDPLPPAPPEPTPRPTPPTPTPAKKPPPPTPGKKPPAPRQELDLDRLLKDIQPASRPNPPHKAGGNAGPPKSATTIQIGSGKRVSAATQGYLLNLGQELGRNWRPNCMVEDGAKVKVKLPFTVGPGGLIKGPPKPPDYKIGQVDAQASAYISAYRAVYAAKFKDFPPELYGEELIVPFDAALVCGRR